MPGISAGMLRALVARAEKPDGPRAVCLEGGGRRHPFPGVYAREALGTLDELPEDGSLQAALDALEAVTLRAPAAILRNVNRPEDLHGPKTLF
jgi:molybdopterin-guanine dinucleotide biosynthesis protein A